jgi:hypothetical protein
MQQYSVPGSQNQQELLDDDIYFISHPSFGPFNQTTNPYRSNRPYFLLAPREA